MTHSQHLSSGGNILYHIFQLQETQYLAGILCSYFLYDFRHEISLISLQRFHRLIFVMGKGSASFEEGTEILYGTIIKWTTVFTVFAFIFSAVPS